MRARRRSSWRASVARFSARRLSVGGWGWAAAALEGRRGEGTLARRITRRACQNPGHGEISVGLPRRRHRQRRARRWPRRADRLEVHAPHRLLWVAGAGGGAARRGGVDARQVVAGEDDLRGGGVVLQVVPVRGAG